MSQHNSDPSFYIEKVCLATDEVLPEAIPPEELLVKHYRDYHVVDTYARSLMSWLVRNTGDEEKARGIMRKVRQLGKSTSNLVAKALGKDPEVVSKALFGLHKRDFYFRFKRHPYTAEQIASRLQELKASAQKQAERGGIRILLTGGTGFVGKEIMFQASKIPEIEEVHVVIRHKTVRNRAGEVIEEQTPSMRGQELLRELWLEGNSKFHFLDGDIEKPQMGIAAAELARLGQRITHMVHCAASVAFDDPYEDSFRANVLGSQNALEFSLGLQNSPDSPFVCHVSVETSYIHGKQVRHVAREDEVVFPRNFYNNYYELTKAMASLETERFMLEHGLRVVQLCPAIVIGDAATGNNRGDQKVVNAPVNAFGRAKKLLKEAQGDWVRRSQAEVLFRMARIFPGDPSAELNLIPVDWVARGILAATLRPLCVGERIHLATDNRITAAKMQEVIRKELRVQIKFSEPTMNRNLHLPVMTKVLTSLKQKKVARALGKLGNIFGGYSEWGQPVHQVGNDVDILGLPLPRPNTEAAFRMLCRHNKFVQDFGNVKDTMELSRRERLWSDFLARLEREQCRPVSEIPSKEFYRLFTEAFDRDTFTPLDKEPQEAGRNA